MTHNQKGFTIIESLVALALLAIVMGISFSSIQQVRNLSSQVSTSESSEKQVLQIIENVRSNMNTFKATYEYYTDEKSEELLAQNKLSMAWDKNILTTVANCQSCKGRYGYVLQPYEKYRGLFILTLKITHENWGANSKKYKFLVSAK